MAHSTLSQYGYLTYKVQEKNGIMVAAENVSVGSHLMAIPLSQCWTKARAAKECWPVAKALLEASTRNPDSVLLQADSTWICLHLISDKRLASAARKVFLEKLPKDIPSVAAASEFSALSLELGVDVVSSLGLDFDTFVWARSVLDKFGMIFAGSNGERTEVLIPGVELFKMDSDIPSPSDVRLESSVAGFSDETVVVYARKTYTAGVEVGFSSIKSHKSSGVPLVVHMPYAEIAISIMEPLCQLLADKGATPAPGDACRAEVETPVEVINRDGKSLVRVTIILTAEKPLPSREVTSLLGIGMLSDPQTLERCYEEEANIPGVLEEDQCDKRALKLIQPDLVRMMADAGAESRSILTSAMNELEKRLKAPPILKAMLRAKPVKELIAVSPATSKSVQWPAEVDKTITMLQASVKEFGMIEQKLKNNATRQAALAELQVAQSCLGSSVFGDPASIPLPEFDSTVPIIKAFGDAAKAAFKALAASYEHECKNGATNAIKAKAFSKLGSVQVRMNEFEAALDSFQKSLGLTFSPTVSNLALEVALIHAAAMPPKPVSLLADVLPLMKKVLAKMGYMKVAIAPPARLPTSLTTALAHSEMIPDSILAQAFSNSSEVPEVVDLVRLFMLHGPLPVKRVRLLLGAKVCTKLLESSYMVCFNPLTAKTLTAAEANFLITSPKSRGAELIFSNIALQPTSSGLLVVSDFDYGVAVDFQAVPYFAQDSAALVASTSALTLSGKLVSSSSIAAGLTALAGEAAVAFKGSDRFMTYAKFSAALNGFEKVSQSNGPFDIIVSSGVRFPNPGNVIGNKGSMFKGWSEDLWSKRLSDDSAHLSKGGFLVITTLVANFGSFSDKLVGPLSSGYHLAVLASKPSGVEELLRHLSTGCSPIHHYAYLEGLLNNGILTTSEVVMLMCKKLDSSAESKSSKVEIIQESKALWADANCLKASVQRVYESMSFAQEVQHLPLMDSIYDFSWDDDEGSTTASDTTNEELGKAALPVSSPWEPKMSVRKSLQKKIETAERPQSAAGAFWKDVGTCHALGWAPPINIFSTWRICPRPQKVTDMPEEMPHMAVVEIEGITVPTYLMDAMRDSFDVKTKYAFDGNTKEFSERSAGRSSRRRKRGVLDDEEVRIPFTACAVIIVPLPPGSYDSSRIVDLPVHMLPFMQAIADRVRMGEQLTIILLTCNAFGPMLESFSDTVSMMGSLTGMCRTVRLEVRGFNVLNVDSDEFMPGGDAMELMAQLSLELLAPDYNAEVCWRSGKRYIRSFEYSARNPIRGTAPLPNISWVDDCPDGVAFITGGTGGLGVCSALSFAKGGCKKIVLCSRKGVLADQPGLKEMIDEIRAMPGVSLLMEKCDTSSEADVKEALERTRKKVGPLKIIVHAAGVLNDQIIDFQTKETMEFSFGPKSDGAWFLHKHTLSDPVESFVCFSSVSSLLGNPGQFNYASANAYMDTLCRWRCHHGMPGCALMWPAVFGVGMAASTILKGQEYNEMDQINSDVVEAVMRQVCCKQFPLEPLVAVCPMNILYPQFPAQMLALEPLYTKYQDQEAFDAAMKALAENQHDPFVLKSGGMFSPH